MESCTANTCDKRFGLSACARMTILKTAIGLALMLGAALYTGETGWYKMAAVLAFFSTFAVGLQVLLPGNRSLDTQNLPVNRHAL